jgi:hypothetical protein
MEIYQQKISAYLEHSKSPQLLAGWTHISICSLSVKYKDATAQTLTLCFSIRTMSATIITGLAVPNCATLIKRASTRCSNNNTVHGTTISEHETNDKMPHEHLCSPGPMSTHSPRATCSTGTTDSGHVCKSPIQCRVMGLFSMSLFSSA